jgi:hypothetical protein
MNPKMIVTVLLLAFVGVSIGYLVIHEAGRTDPAPSALSRGTILIPGVSGAEGAGDLSAGATTLVTHKVIAYYFHATQRCPTCRKIEHWAETAVRTGFADALDRGELEWRVLNMDDAPNAHFVTDYGLVTSSLVIVDLREGTQSAWKNMGRVWELVHDDETAFKEYVAEQVREYLES